MGLTEIKIINKVPTYSTFENGSTVYFAIRNELANGNNIVLSFEGIAGVPSSFVNGLFNKLIEEIGIDGIKQRIRITHSTRMINDMLKRKFALAAN